MAACEWHWWVRELHNYFKTMNENSTKMQRALLLQLGGSELFEIYQLIVSEDCDEKLKAVLMAINKYFDPRSNAVHTNPR